jgi:hypothetical protein
MLERSFAGSSGNDWGDARLRGRALHCAVATATIPAADVMAKAGREG